MWKVTNKSNCKKLGKFEKNIIIPFFTELLYFKRQTKHSDFVKYLENKKYDVLLYICKGRANNIRFIDCVTQIVNEYTYDQIKKYYYIYIIQNKQIRKKEKNITFFEIPIPFQNIFVEFFYKKYFSRDKLWKYFDESSFSRKEFHENFKKDNNKIEVCPYCDIDTIRNRGNKQVEHFWPKSRFPFLAMNALNLISSCHSCNMPLEGKGNKVNGPISTPYIKQIGDYVNFSFDLSNRKLKISSYITDVDNYLDLLNLKVRYAELDVYDCFCVLYSSILQYESKEGKNLTSSELEEYIKWKNGGLYFAFMNIYNNYDKYKLYLYNLKQ